MLKTVNAALKAKAIKFGLEVLQAKAWPRGAQGQGLPRGAPRGAQGQGLASRCSRPRPGLEVLKAKASRCSRPGLEDYITVAHICQPDNHTSFSL